MQIVASIEFYAISTSRNKRRGCERVANDTAMIGDDMATKNERNEAMLETEDFKKRIKSMRNHVNRIKYAHEFLEKIFNENFSLGARDISSEELQHPSKIVEK